MMRTIREMPASHYIRLYATQPGRVVTPDFIEEIAGVEDVTPEYVRRVLKREGIAIEAKP